MSLQFVYPIHQLLHNCRVVEEKCEGSACRESVRGVCAGEVRGMCAGSVQGECEGSVWRGSV